MAESDDLLTNRVGERLQVLNRDITKLGEDAGDDPIDQLNAKLDAYTVALRTLAEIAVTLAGEIDQLKHQLDRPS